MNIPNVFVKRKYENNKKINTIDIFQVIRVQIRGISDKKPHFITQPELNDLVGYVILSNRMKL